MTNDQWRDFEIEHRRKLDDGAIHPDSCPKLRLHGVDFAIPPRDVKIRMTFKDGKATVADVDDDYPEADTFLKLSPMEPTDICETCGRPQGGELVIDVQRDIKYLEVGCTLAAAALSRQYNLTDEDFAALLIGNDKEWLSALTAWAVGTEDVEA